MRPEFIELPVETDLGANPTGVVLTPEIAARPLEGFLDHTIQVVGAFTGSLRVEVSLDGATWVELAAHTAPGIAYYAGSYRYIRIRTAALSAGTPRVFYGGMFTRVDQ